MPRVVVIGAGIGGLAAGARLARAGLDVTVLEAHVYPGGCAGTFYHQGYRFDAGATLAGGFYPSGPMNRLGEAVGIEDWGARCDDLAMLVHLPDGRRVGRWANERALAESVAVFGPGVQKFWRWQQSTAEALWDLALRLPPWPAQGARQAGRLASTGLAWASQDLTRRLSPGLLRDAFRPLAAHLQGTPAAFKLFIDAQLLISAQTTSAQANALYAASALDLPRRGVAHLPGGVGSIARQLAAAILRHGGKVLYRQEAIRLHWNGRRIAAVETQWGQVFPADAVVANLAPWSVKRLVGEAAGVDHRLARLGPAPSGWGAFTAYIGFDGAILEPGFPLHHQVILERPLAEGGSIFLSVSPEWDAQRAPETMRAMTISTHTNLEEWWNLYHTDRAAYAARREAYLARLLDAAERAVPGLQQAARLRLAGTPVTFQRFTHRPSGWVGGFPQTGLLQNWAPRLGANLWMVGDSIFPGQSIAAAALGGLRVGGELLEQAGRRGER